MRKLLPPHFETLTSYALQQFWSGRSRSGTSQPGGRGAVIGGKNLDGFVELTQAIAIECGIASDAMFFTGRSATLPGYFRATKNWDILIFHDNNLVAALEFKSQVGSFGNNFNNRTEEAIGSAVDILEAARSGAFYPENRAFVEHSSSHPDPRPPFVGFVMILEDTARSNVPVNAAEPHFRVFEEFENASYAERYTQLCERLMEKRLYDAAALVLTQRDTDAYRSVSVPTSLQTFYTSLAAHLLSRTESF